MKTDEIENEKMEKRMRMKSISSRIPEEQAEFNKIEKSHNEGEKIRQNRQETLTRQLEIKKGYGGP